MEILDKLIRMLGEKGPKIRIGILSDSARYSRNAGDEGRVSTESNADVGARHEFGLGVPQRSWLRMPLETELEKFLKVEDINEKSLEAAIKEGNLVPVAEKIQAAAENCVQGAFETGGYGQWPSHAPGYTNATGELLQDTLQMRNAISSEIEEN